MSISNETESHGIEGTVRNWCHSIFLARWKAADEDWDAATTAYGQAYDFAELMLGDSKCQCGQHRFIRTSLEFVYALRKYDSSTDYSPMLPIMRSCLVENGLGSEADKLLLPIVDVALSPINMVDQWMLPLIKPILHKSDAVH